jgi:hypothetical protein
MPKLLGHGIGEVGIDQYAVATGLQKGPDLAEKLKLGTFAHFKWKIFL